MKRKLWSLTLGNFAIGTGAMIVPGMLNELSADLAVSPAAIGVIISAFALTICVCGPFLAGWTSAIERRKLLTAALVLYALTHFLAALSPGYGMLLAVRIATAIGAALFTSQAAATASLLVPAQQRGKAIGLVFLGWSISAVIGMPVGAYLGAHLGWRPTMAIVGALSALFAAWVWTQIPGRLYVAKMDRVAWKSLFSNPALLLAISVTAIQAAGMFTVTTYLALMLKDFIGATPPMISLVFAAFGLTGVVGNIIGSRVMDRVGTARVGMISMACMALAMALWPFTRGSLPITLALALLFGAGGFAVNSSQQARLIDLAPQLASASIALNSSAIYLGQAFGALSGGALVATRGTAELSLVGSALMVVAMAVSRVASGMALRRAAVKTA
ncbi:MAG: transporter [Herminiimonas sp.]|nr:transporter [Herminiimonas sp.]